MLIEIKKIKVKRFYDKVKIILNILGKGTSRENRAELFIGILNRTGCKDMHA